MGDVSNPANAGKVGVSGADSKATLAAVLGAVMAWDPGDGPLGMAGVNVCDLVDRLERSGLVTVAANGRPSLTARGHEAMANAAPPPSVKP